MVIVWYALKTGCHGCDSEADCWQWLTHVPEAAIERKLIQFSWGHSQERASPSEADGFPVSVVVWFGSMPTIDPSIDRLKSLGKSISCYGKKSFGELSFITVRAIWKKYSFSTIITPFFHGSLFVAVKGKFDMAFICMCTWIDLSNLSIQPLG